MKIWACEENYIVGYLDQVHNITADAERIAEHYRRRNNSPRLDPSFR